MGASEVGIQERIRAWASNPEACMVAVHIPVDRTVVDHKVAEVASAVHTGRIEVRMLAVACTVAEELACTGRFQAEKSRLTFRRLCQVVPLLVRRP